MARQPQAGPFTEHAPNRADLVPATGDRGAEQAFDELMALLPLDVVTKLVNNYYERHRASVRAAAAGDILTQLTQELEGVEKERLEALIRGLPDPDTRKLDAKLEATTARRAFVAYWLNAVDEAMRTLDTHGRVTLSASLLPPRPEPGSPAEVAWNKWEDRRSRSEESVLANVALDPQDLNELKIMFARNMTKTVKARGQVVIPPDDVLVSSGNGFELRPARK